MDYSDLCSALEFLNAYLLEYQDDEALDSVLRHVRPGETLDYIVSTKCSITAYSVRVLFNFKDDDIVILENFDEDAIDMFVDVVRSSGVIQVDVTKSGHGHILSYAYAHGEYLKIESSIREHAPEVTVYKNEKAFYADLRAFYTSTRNPSCPVHGGNVRVVLPNKNAQIKI